jgi:predicted alpha/beta superfamily hydrolase
VLSFYIKFYRNLSIGRQILVCGLLFLFGCSEQQSIEQQNTVKVTTAAANVEVLETPILIPKLSRERTIRVYLPPDYDKSSQTYSVLYMHDGQNLFDDATSFVGEWKVDETLNRLYKERGLALIVVGIDNGAEKRMNEMSPWLHQDFAPAEGKEYMDFIVNVLKPYIDKRYRTKPTRIDTAIMGSSMGGVISHYGIHEFSPVFSKAGIFSPSFWFTDEVFKHTADKPIPKDAKVYFLVGAKEGSDMVSNTQKMVLQLTEQQHPKQNIFFKQVQDGIHNESFWANEFEQAILWLFSES